MNQIIKEISELSLADGRKISIEAMHLSQTYANLLAGLPDKDVNQRIIRDKKKLISKIFTEKKKKCISLKPVVERWTKTYPEDPETPMQVERLPRFCIAAECYCDQPVQDGDGSKLVVFWFQDSPYPFLSEENHAKFKAIDWQSLAEDGGF